MLLYLGGQLAGSLLILFVLRGMPAVRSLAFRHCIGLYLHRDSLSCTNQRISNLTLAVSDIPSTTRVLNISFNMIRVLPRRGLENLMSLQCLRLDHNYLSSIKPGAFSRLHSLRELNLSHNHLEFLEQGAFSSLSNLTSLILQHNRLRDLSGDTVLPLKRLRALDISFNSFRNVSAVFAALERVPALRVLNFQSSNIRYLDISTRFPPQLSHLLLANNPISGFRAPVGFFANVTYLDLSNCNFSRVENLTSINFSRLLSLNINGNPMNRDRVIEAVQKLKAPLTNIILSYLNLGNRETLQRLCGTLQRRIRSVSLEGNNLQDVSGAFSRCDSVSFLDLSHNKIKKPDMFICGGAPNNLRTLILDHNIIRDVSLCDLGRNGGQYNRSACCLGQLRHLSFRYNHISAIRSHAFQHVPNLESLSLALNELNFINITAFAGLNRLKFLSLTNNAIGEVFPRTFSLLGSLEHLKLRNNRIPIVYNGTYSGLPKLITLDLGGNHIEKIRKGGFQGLRSLVNLYLDRNWLSTISAEMFKDLQSLQVLDLANNKLSFRTDSVQFPPFVALRRLRMLKLPSQERSGLMALPHHLFDGLEHLQNLDISDNKFATLDTLPFHRLNELEVLQMNDIYYRAQTMHNKTFANLVNLRLLRLENAGLESIRGVLLGNLTSLATLMLRGNRIRIIEKEDIPQLSNLSYLDLRENLFSCVCANLWFQQWAMKSKVEVPFFYEYPCIGQAQATKLLVQFDRLVCDNGFVAFCVTAPVIVAFVLAALGYRKGKWGIYYSYYLLRAWIHEKQLKRSHARGHRYDAFVSYNSKDEGWVLEQLMQHLEAEGPPFHHLCFHHRDFTVGKPIVENIVDAIYNSKKTLCIISKNYLQSEWCSMEMQVALYRLFDERSDVLILVFLDEIPSYVLSSYHHLRKLLRKKTYINWPADDTGQKLFWTKLREALKGDSPSSREHPLIQHASLLY